MAPERKLPKYVKRQPGPGGRHYLYFRYGKTYQRLPDDPNSADFYARYAALLASVEAPAQEAAEGTLASAIAGYKGSEWFTDLAAKTARDYGRYLDLLAPYGHWHIGQFKRRHIKEIQKQHFKDKPRAADYFVRVVSVVFEYAIEELELIDTNPVAKMKPRNKSEAYTAWSDDECERFEASKPPRFLLTTYMLCRYTGQRLGDVLAWTRGVYNGKELRFRQSKGRRHGNQEMVIPVLPPLKVYLDALPRADNTLLLVSKEDGSAYDESYVRHELRERLDACGLKRLHFHGLRHAAGRDFAEAGASVKEIMAWLGHKTPTMAIHYTQAAEQKKLAQAAGKKWAAARESNTE